MTTFKNIDAEVVILCAVWIAPFPDNIRFQGLEKVVLRFGQV